MYLNNNSLQYKQFENFQRYAQFICERFDVRIEMDASRAETDGRVIYIPNVLSMTAKEINLMYGILLHESGHIRYSSFDESYFSALKSEAHAFLANAIEDARVENLLLKDFAGAKEIFEQFYCEYTQDPELMGKVFKTKTKSADIFESVGFFLHNELVNFETPSLSAITKYAKRVALFWKSESIDQLIKSAPLRNDADVIALTNEVYERFLRFSKVKDNSAKLDYKREQEKKENMEQMLDKLRAKASKVEGEVVDLKTEISDINQARQNFDLVNEALVNSLSAQKSAVKSQLDEIVKQLEWKSSVDSARAELQNMPSRKEKVEQNAQSQREERAQLETKLAHGKNGRGKDLNDAQKDALNQKIEMKKRQEARAQERLATLDQEAGAARDELRELLAESARNSSLNEDLNIEEKDAELETKRQELASLDSKLSEIAKARVGFENALKKAEEKVEKIQGELMEQMAQSMFALDKMDASGNFGMEFMPGLNHEDAWPEASVIQTAFDEKATQDSGKMVRNGQRAAGMFGSNVRDILTYIDKKLITVKEIDVAEIFKEKIQSSRLDDLNATVKQVARSDKSVVGVFGTYREHIPLTTQFDVVKKETQSKESAEFQKLVSKNATFYKELVRVFSRRFKFAKKPYWKGGQEDGSFDTRNLWKLPTKQGDDFYEVTKHRFENKMAATILVDISGSQNKGVTEYGEKIRALAIGLSKALDAVHVKHEVLGYHAPVSEELRALEASNIYTRRSNRLETVVVKEASQKDQMGLMNLEPKLSDNSDGESLRIAVRRLKAMRAKSHVLFIISDGKPFLCDTDMSVLDEDLRQALRGAVKEKIQVFGLGYFDQLGEFLGDRFCNATDEDEVLKFFDRITV